MKFPLVIYPVPPPVPPNMCRGRVYKDRGMGGGYTIPLSLCPLTPLPHPPVSLSPYSPHLIVTRVSGALPGKQAETIIGGLSAGPGGTPPRVESVTSTLHSI